MTDTPEWIVYGEGFADVTMTPPAKIAGATVPTLRMREPTVADQLAASEIKGSNAAQEMGMFGNLCELAPEDMRGLSMRNYKRLQAAYMGFTD